MAIGNIPPVLAYINPETAKLDFIVKEAVLNSINAQCKNETSVPITIEYSENGSMQYDISFKLKLVDKMYVEDSSLWGGTYNYFTRASKTAAIIHDFLFNINQAHGVELVKTSTHEPDLNQWDITTDEDKNMRPHAYWGNDPATAQPHHDKLAHAHQLQPSTPKKTTDSATFENRHSQPEICPAQNEKIPEAELPAIDFCMSTYQKMHNSAKPLDRVFKECSFNEFFTVMVNNPDFFNSFHTELNRMSTKAQFVLTLTRIRSNQLSISTPRDIQLSFHHSNIKKLNSMNPVYLPSTTTTATASNTIHAAKEVDFVDESTTDLRVCRKKIARLDSYKKYADPKLKTLFVLDLDDTLSCRAILDQYRHDTVINATNYDSLCGQIALHPNLKAFIDELKDFGNDSRVILVTNAKNKYLNEKLQPTSLSRENFDSVSVLEDAPQGHSSGDKEFRVLQDCKNSGFEPEQIVTFDDEDTHLRKIELMSLSELNVSRCVSLHVKTAVPSRHGEVAVSSFVFTGRNDTYPNFLKTLYHYSYLEKDGKDILDTKGQKVRDMRFVLEKEEFDLLLQ